MTTQVETQENTQKNTPANSANNVINLAPNRKPKQQTLVANTLKNATAPRMLLSTLKNNFNSAQKANKVNSFADKMNERNYAAEMLPAMQQPRTVANVEKVSGLQNERIAKTATPQYAQYAGDDVEQMAGVYTAAPGYRDDVDYASAIKTLSLQPITPENQAIMRNLLSGRNAKVAAGGEDLAQYADDEVSALAKDYLKQYAPEKIDANAIYDRADVREENNYAEAERSLAQQQRLQLENLKANYEAQRRAADLAYAMKSRNMEAMLAEQGLGRGLGAGPSSGYSESARLGALSDYANNINQTYQQQAADSRELAAQFEAQRMQAMAERNAAIRANDEARIAQMNADRSYGFDAHKYNRDADNQEMLTQAQRDNLNADTNYRTIESEYAPDMLGSDIDAKKASTELVRKETANYDADHASERGYKDALTKGANEDATGKWIDNQTRGARNQAELDILGFDAELAKAKLPMVDDFALAALSEARNVGGGVSGGGGRASGSSTKKKTSSGGSGGGVETYGDDILGDLEDILGEEGEAPYTVNGYIPTTNPEGYTIIENGKVVEERGTEKVPLWQLSGR